MPAIDVDVVRSLLAGPELRASKGDEGLGILSGHFSVFNNWYRVSSVWEGEFLERTAVGFTAETIAANRNSMRVMFDHGFDNQIGNKSLGELVDLREDEEGAYYEVRLDDTSFNRDLLPGFRRGAYGASFRMKVQEDSWVDEPETSEYNPRGLPERTIIRADVSELGPVAWPANPKATAQVRSSTDEFYSRLKQRDEAAVAAACRAAGISYPDFTAADPRRGRDGGSGHDGEPGKAARSQPSQEALQRHTELLLLGVIKK